MAEFGEACTHIGAILFYLEAVYRFEEAKTCTQGLCAWNVPSLKKIEYLPINEIDFTSAKGKKCKLDDALEGTTIVSEETVAIPKERSRPTSDESALFFNNVSHQGTKPAIVSLIPDYSDRYCTDQFQLDIYTRVKREYLKNLSCFASNMRAQALRLYKFVELL